VLARREGSHTANVQGNPPGCFQSREPCRGLIQATGARGIGVREGTRARLSHDTPSRRTLARGWPQLGRPLPGTARLVLPRATAGRRAFAGTGRGPGVVCYEAKNRFASKTSPLRSRG
jgi:hypothetical protein